MTKDLKLDSVYHGEISVVKPSYKKVTVNGVTRHVHVVDSDTWKNIKEQLGIVEERIEENSLHETIGKFKHIPPHFRPEYYHSGNIIEQKEKQK